MIERNNVENYNDVNNVRYELMKHSSRNAALMNNKIIQTSDSLIISSSVLCPAFVKSSQYLIMKMLKMK